MTWAASQQAEGVFRLVNLLLTGFVEQTETDGVGPAALERLRNLMLQRVASQPLLEDLVLVDANGISVVDGRPATPLINLSDREYFQHLRAHPNDGPYFGSAVNSRLTGRLIIPVSQRVNNVDGSFAGLLVATVDAGYFLDFYATFSLGHDGVASLWRDDGTLMVRQSQAVAKPAAERGSQSGTPIRYLFPEAPRGTYEVTSRIDGITRIVSYRRLPGYPLVVAMSLGKAEQLANWRADAAEHLLAAVFVAVVLGLLGVRLVAQARLVVQAERANALAAAASNADLTRLSESFAQARDRAEQATQAKSRFLAGITHELRTPLHGILGYAELLCLEGDLNLTQSARLEVMMASGQHLLDMINSVLDLSQIEADRLELQPVEVDLPDLIRTCLNVIRPAAEAKGLVLGQAPTVPLRLVADPTRLRQVLINLLGNAVKFTPEGSVEVRLRPAEAGANIRLEVADSGPGIWLRHRDKLFQAFERFNAGAVNAIEGQGLGLAIAARLVHLMGGQIGYVDNPGGGSVFWLELPANDVVAAASVDVDASSSPLAGRLRLRVLVADDEAVNRSIASGFLHSAGHEVVCVDSGAAAVDAAKAQDFDVILMDVRMPVMDGLEATRRIRALPAPHGAVRIVAVTAQTFAQQIAMCRSAGMNGHVSKPFKQAVLLATLEDIMNASSGPAAAALSPPAPAIDDEPVFDRATFEDITELLPAAEVEEYLQSLITRCETLLRGLRGPEMPVQANKFVEDAHTLAGGAGTFGFLSVAAAARRFETAPDTAAFADQLVAAIEASMAIIRQELAAVSHVI